MRNHVLLRTPLAFLLMLTGGVAAHGQRVREDAPFVWTKQLAPGATLAIRNGNGPIRVNESSSDRVEVRATKGRATQNTHDVTFDVEEASGRTTVCTLSDRQTRCGSRTRSSQGRPVTVEFTVLVPRNMRLELATGSGEIIVDRAGDAVSAATGNGRVFVATSAVPCP